MAMIPLRPSAIETALHAGKAAFAAATASSSCAFDARAQLAKTSSVAGLITSRIEAPSTRRPSINSLKSDICSLHLTRSGRSRRRGPVSVPENALIEFSGGQARHLRDEVDRARHHVTRHSLAGEGDQ